MIVFLITQKKLSNAQIESYELTGVFSPNPLRKSIFTVVAKDNIDFNTTSSTAVKHFHGTSMTVMEFPVSDNLGNSITLQECVQSTNEESKNNSKKVWKSPGSYKTVKFLSVRKTPLYASNISVDILDCYDNGQFLASETLKEQSWLENISDIDNIRSWSKYNSDNSSNISVKSINAVLPIILKPVHTLSIKYHCIEVIKKTIDYLNPGQTLVDVCDQPVYALTKEI